MSKIKNLLIKNWPIILVILLSAFLRLYRVRDYMTFLGDEGRDAIVVYNILHGKLTLLGPTASVGGFFLGPIYYYFMALFTLFFNYDPVGPSVMVALIGVATVWFVYKIGNSFFNKTTGLIAALLYAISPVVIAYSRSSWNPNIVPFFSLCALYAIYKALNQKSTKWLIACGFFLGIGLQLHYLITFLIAIIFIYLLISKLSLEREIKITKKFLSIIKSYFFILIGLIIGWSPFLAFEVRHGFMNTTSIYNFILKSGDTGSGNQFFSIIYDVFFRLYARLVLAFPSFEHFSDYSKTSILLWQILALVIGTGSTILLFYLLFKNIKHKEKFLQLNLLAVWLVLGIVLFGFYKKSIYDYYFGFIFPLPFLLVANLASTIWAKSKIILKFLIAVFLIFTVWINAQGVPFRYEPNRQLDQMEAIAKFVFTKTDSKPFNFALISGSNSDHAYRYFFTIWGKPPVTIDYVGKDPQRKTVTDQLFVVCESLPCQPLGHSLWEIAGFGRAEIEEEWDISVVKIYKLVHYKGK